LGGVGGPKMRCGGCRAGEHHRHQVARKCPCWCHGPSLVAAWEEAVIDRVGGGLLGLCVGDCLGATCEFMTAEQIASRLGRHTEITGGGAFGWAPGEGTDDSDMAIAVARAYAQGYSLEAVAEGFLAWYHKRPKDIGGTTAAALGALNRGGDARASGRTDDRSAGNGGLMRAIATGLARPNTAVRRQEAQEISAVTHGERRCKQAALVYCDLANHLVEGASPVQALAWAFDESPVDDDVADVLRAGPRSRPQSLDTSGYVLATLGVAVWALCSGLGFEEALVTVVNLGGDADTTGAVAGGLLGAHYGRGAVPSRWAGTIAYGTEVSALASALSALRLRSPGLA
jgi:ADP-ribosyl-[dinitrogen reductase] hydrolase